MDASQLAPTDLPQEKNGSNANKRQLHSNKNGVKLNIFQDGEKLKKNKGKKGKQGDGLTSAQNKKEKTNTYLFFIK